MWPQPEVTSTGTEKEEPKSHFVLPANRQESVMGWLSDWWVNQAWLVLAPPTTKVMTRETFCLGAEGCGPRSPWPPKKGSPITPRAPKGDPAWELLAHGFQNVRGSHTTNL